MKKITTVFMCVVLSTVSLFAQWNENGNNKSTGGLSVNNGVFTTSRSGVRVSGAPLNSSASLKLVTETDSVLLNLNKDTKVFGILRSAAVRSIYMTDFGNVGLGVKEPTVKLDIYGSAKASGSISASSGVFSTNPYGIRIATPENRSPQLKIAAASDSAMFTLDRADGTLKLLRYIDGAARTHLFFTKDQKVGILNATPTAALDVKGDIKAAELSVTGTIYAKSVKVRVDAGADYVFDADYKLRDLSEVEAFVKEKRHLPEIQSEKDMQANGVDLNEFQIKLLQKIEELTLYSIQQNNQIKEQNEKILQQNRRIEQLEQNINQK